MNIIRQLRVDHLLFLALIALGSLSVRRRPSRTPRTVPTTPWVPPTAAELDSAMFTHRAGLEQQIANTRAERDAIPGSRDAWVGFQASASGQKHRAWQQRYIELASELRAEQTVLAPALAHDTAHITRLSRRNASLHPPAVAALIAGGLLALALAALYLPGANPWRIVPGVLVALMLFGLLKAIGSGFYSTAQTGTSFWFGRHMLSWRPTKQLRWQQRQWATCALQEMCGRDAQLTGEDRELTFGDSDWWVAHQRHLDGINQAITGAADAVAHNRHQPLPDLTRPTLPDPRDLTPGSATAQALALLRSGTVAALSHEPPAVSPPTAPLAPLAASAVC